MARYIELVKVSDVSREVVYAFDDDGRRGTATVDRADGAVRVAGETDAEIPDGTTMRITIKLRQFWRDGSFPERGCWAS